jgi:hypothetical protein
MPNPNGLTEIGNSAAVPNGARVDWIDPQANIASSSAASATAQVAKLPLLAMNGSLGALASSSWRRAIAAIEVSLQTYDNRLSALRCGGLWSASKKTSPLSGKKRRQSVVSGDHLPPVTPSASGDCGLGSASALGRAAGRSFCGDFTPAPLVVFNAGSKSAPGWGNANLAVLLSSA